MAPAAEAELAAWLGRQRWYGAKGAAIASVRVADRIPELALVDVTPESQSAARYTLPEYGGRSGLDDAAERAHWFELFLRAAEIEGERGRFVFERVETLGRYGSSKLLGAEQSNTSVLYSGAAGEPRWILKLFRRVQNGESPDFEIPRALARYTGFSHVPAAAGRLRYRAGEAAATLAVIQSYVANHGDGWEFFLARLGSGQDTLALFADLELLGRRTAELHAALASIPGDTAFAPEPITAADGEHWRQRALVGAAAAAPEDAALLQRWCAQLSAGETGLEALIGCHKIRIHGDYHLGQTLKTAGDFYLIDFEGEPARPLAERRRKGTALQDVAGMLRSLGYAAHAAGQPDWEAPARAAFLRGYRSAITQAPVRLVPDDDRGLTAACRFFEIEKAVYELAYERRHRPVWAAIPLAALPRLLGEK